MSIKLYVEAIKQWGIDSQLDMLTEEAAELIAAVNKYRRSNGKIITKESLYTQNTF
jgi:NTP pyrophosphatase (non-canonical NTP hydrolase)